MHGIRIHLTLSVLAFLPLQLAACSDGHIPGANISTSEECQGPCDTQDDDDVPKVIEICDDGIDNDADGNIDCEDFTCQSVPFCQEGNTSPPENCSDMIDNDQNGDIDCEDASCILDVSCQVLPVTPEICDDGFDNDQNDDVDCADFACRFDSFCLDTSACTDFSDQDTVSAADYDAFGNGSGNEPYRLYTADQIYDIHRYQEALNKEFVLCNDIDMGDLSTASTPFFSIGSSNMPFTGRFDGLGHVVHGFHIDVSDPEYIKRADVPLLDAENGVVTLRDNDLAIGLFGFCEDAVLLNLQLIDASIVAGTTHVGLLVGRQQDSDIENVFVSGNIVNTSNHAENGSVSGVGGVVGNCEGWGAGASIRDTESEVSITGDSSNVGGIVGKFNGCDIQETSARAIISSAGVSTNIGGIVGSTHDGSIDQTESAGLLEANSSIGGVVGQATNTMITNVIVHSDVRYNSSAETESSGGLLGGLVGHGTGITLSSGSATGEIRGRNGSVGGAIGVLEGHSIVRRTHAAGRVTTSNSTQTFPSQPTAGGLIGVLRGASQIQYAYATGEVELIRGRGIAGGLIGQVVNDAVVSDVYATGQVQSGIQVGSAQIMLGGLIGHVDSNGLVQRCYASGDVFGQYLMSGGLIGRMSNNAIVHDCFAAASEIENATTAMNSIAVVGSIAATSTLNDCHFWSGAVCNAQTCGNNNGEHSQPDRSYFYDPTNAPMNTWTFGSEAWMETPGSYPIFAP